MKDRAYGIWAELWVNPQHSARMLPCQVSQAGDAAMVIGLQ